MNSFFYNLSQVKNKFSRWVGFLYYSNWLPWIIILIGIILRIVQYTVVNSLGLDESALALNIVNKSFLELLKPLDYYQVAPFGFLIIEKLLVQSFGNNEYILRMFPFICGIISLFLFYWVAKHTIKREAVIIALGLFVLSGYLINYSSEAKQYSSDVAVALLLYAVTIFFQSQGFKTKHIIFFGVIGTIATCISHPAAFVLAGIGINLFLLFFVKKNWLKLSQFSIVYSIWILVFTALFIISSTDTSSTIKWMRSGWTSSFIPIQSSFTSNLRWFISKFFGIFERPAGFHFNGIAAFAFLIGCVSMFSQNKQRGWILLSPIFVTLLVSGFHWYPFSGRLLLFIVPPVLLFIAEGTEYIRDKISRNATIIGIIFIGLLFIHPVLSVSYNLVSHSKSTLMTLGDIKPVMRYIKEHKQNGDVLYLYYSSYNAFKYYAERYEFNDNEYIVGVTSINNWKNYINDLNKLRENKRVWILFTHYYKYKSQDDKKILLYHLNSSGKRLDHFKSDGAAVYLYDLSEAVLTENGKLIKKT